MRDLNFSHGDHAEHKVRIDRINEAARKKGKVVGILLDTRGPEIRTHSMKDGRVELVTGQNSEYFNDRSRRNMTMYFQLHTIN